MALGRSQIAALVGGGAAVVVAVVAIAGRQFAEPEGKGGCPAPAVDQDAEAGGEPLNLVEPDDELVIDFGTGRERRIDSVDVLTSSAELPDDWQAFRVNVSTLSFAGRRELRGEGLVAEARRVTRTEIEVTLCVDPTVVDVRAGRYQGKVRFDDPRLEDLEVEAIVYAQQTTAWAWIAMALAAGLLASLVAYSLHGRDEQDERLRSAVQRLSILLVVAAGFAAAFTQSTRAYSANRSWGSDGFDGAVLVGQAIALAYGATVATTDIVRAMMRRRGTEVERPSPRER